jgi:2-isopropylmalate synthase
MLPDEFSAFLRGVQENVPTLSGVTLGVGCSDDLSMADACAVAAIRAGAAEIKCAAYAVNTVRLEHVSRLLNAKGADFGACCSIRTNRMSRVMDQIERMCRAGRADDALYSGGAGEEGFFLTAHDDISAVLQAVAKLGYELSEEDGAKVFSAFSGIASKKENVSARELDAIVASVAMQVPPTYRLVTYVINTGNTISATAYLKLDKNGQSMEGLGMGDGPIDAAFRSVEQIIGHHYELDDFQIQAVTEGREAMGEALIKIRSGGKLYSGRGISTDIIGASIRAYISALNKIVYEDSAV